MYKIYVVEDMAISRAALIDMLEDNDHTVVGSSARADKAWLEIKNQDIDLVLLDVNLAGDHNGIWLAQKIRKSYNLPFVYLTAYGDPGTLEKLQDTAPNGYLMKPYNTPTLLTTIDIAIQSFKLQQSQPKKPAFPETIFIKEAGGQVKLSLDTIIFIKSDGNYIEIHTRKKVHLIRAKIANFLASIGAPYFVQVHRRYAVNLKEVTAIRMNVVLIKNVEIPLSHTYKKDFLELLEKF